MELPFNDVKGLLAERGIAVLCACLRLIGLVAVSKDESFALRYGISIIQDLCSGQQFTSGGKNDNEE